MLHAYPKLAIVVLGVHYEPLKSHLPEKCEHRIPKATVQRRLWENNRNATMCSHF